MKSLVKCLILVVYICLLHACNNENEGTKPESIAEYGVTPIHGGAIITYSIPNDPDILYVMAEFERNGKACNERASVYEKSLTIEGFNTTNPVSVALYTVSRGSEIKSNPKTLEFTPLESPVSLAQKSVRLYEGFGSLYVIWDNETKTDLTLRLMVRSEGKTEERGILFSSSESGRHYFRGFDNVETHFLLTLEDRWGNVSDTVRFTGTPMFETEVEKPWTDMRSYFPYDNTTRIASDRDLPKIWDNAYSDRTNCYFTASGSAGSSFSFDFRQVVKLSRVVLWTYHPIGGGSNYVYDWCAVVEFEMWGTKALDVSKLPPADDKYWLHPFSAAQTGQDLPAQTPGQSFMVDWVYLGRYTVPRLDMEGASQTEISTAASAGWQFDIPPDCDPVRIIRFFPVAGMLDGLWASPPNGNYWNIGELSFFGDNTVPQE